MRSGIIVTCPVCGDGMHVRRLSCVACDTEIHGDFTPDPLTCLSEAQRGFVVTFLQVGGNLREMERLLGISYPTVRSRMTDILEKMGVHQIKAHAKGDLTRHEILEMLADGKISSEDAARRIDSE